MLICLSFEFHGEVTQNILNTFDLVLNTQMRERRRGEEGEEGEEEKEEKEKEGRAVKSGHPLPP